MSDSRNRSVRLGVISAAGLVIVLAGTLVAALLGGFESAASGPPAPPPGTVPAPHPCDITKLSIPCWSCPSAENWPLRFVTNLDMLAPLGTGNANAATWFAAFAKPDGPRLADLDAAMARRVDRPPIGMVFPPGDPLLAEAGPWCDQATMRFYPEIFPIQGFDTQIPHLFFMLNLARSWIARGTDAPSFDDAMADVRRVIRLGRLLRQEDAVLINDLVGLACIRIGAEAIYDRARKDGRTELALLAAVVAAEAPPQKYLTAARVTEVEITPYIRRTAMGAVEIDVPKPHLDAAMEMASSSPDRRFRCEATLTIGYVAALGVGPARASAREQLERLASDKDPIVAANARWSLTAPSVEKYVEELLGGTR